MPQFTTALTDFFARALMLTANPLEVSLAARDANCQFAVLAMASEVEGTADPALRDIHNASFLSTPDGMPMVWMGKLAGSRVISRVYGPDMMLMVLKEGRRLDQPVGMVSRPSTE